MFYAHYRKKSNKKSASKFHLSPHRSSPKLQKKIYRDWVYQISLRTMGLTRQREIYCVTIWTNDGTKGHYISNLKSHDTARSQAERWIDAKIQQKESAHSQYEKRKNQIDAKIRIRLDEGERS